MTDIITKFLASLLDKFKVKNPKLFLFIQIGLGAIEMFLVTSIQEGALTGNGTTDVILTIVIPLLMGVLGTRTTQHMQGTKALAKMRAQEDGYKAYNDDGAIRAKSVNPDYYD